MNVCRVCKNSFNVKTNKTFVFYYEDPQYDILSRYIFDTKECMQKFLKKWIV